MKKILVIRHGAIGDVVHSSIIQQAVKQTHPEVEVHFMTTFPASTLIENDPNLEKVIIFDNKKKNDFAYLVQLGLSLRKEKYDAIFVLTNSLRNFILTALASPKKIARRSNQRNHAVDAFFNSAKKIFSNIEKPTKQKLYLPKESEEKIAEILLNHTRPIVTISPGGENDKYRQGRILPLQTWMELIKRLTNDYGATVFITGSGAEAEYQKTLQTDKTIFLTGALSLTQSAALYASSDLFISGDSGPLHIAAALNTKTIGLMGSTTAQACGPYGDDCYSLTSKHDCVGCNKTTCDKILDKLYTPCMQAISADEIIELINNNELLKS